jgi:hypothetical protein
VGQYLANGVPDCLRDGLQFAVSKRVPVRVPDFDLEAGEPAWPVVVKVGERGSPPAAGNSLGQVVEAYTWTETLFKEITPPLGAAQCGQVMR